MFAVVPHAKQKRKKEENEGACVLLVFWVGAQPKTDNPHTHTRLPTMQRTSLLAVCLLLLVAGTFAAQRQTLASGKAKIVRNMFKRSNNNLPGLESGIGRGYDLIYGRVKGSVDLSDITGVY